MSAKRLKIGARVPYLPAELISHILENCASKATVAIAARCSRRWYDIAMPLLYHRVDVNNPPYDSAKSYLKSLAVLFLSKPHIAAHVRHFSVRYEGKDGLEREIEQDNALSEKIQDAIASVTYCNDEERASWLMEEDSEDTFLALLLPTLPNVLSLDLMTSAYAKHTDRVLRRFGARAERGSAFTKLKSLFWTARQEPRMPQGTVVCPGIFAMPSIENIYLHRSVSGYRDEADRRLVQFSPRTSACTHLELRDCYFHPSDLQSLLLIPKVLSTFIYEIGDHQLPYCTVSYSKIRRGLEHHKETLEELSLSYCRYFSAMGLGDHDGPLPMAPLNGFLKLKRLKIPQAFIRGRGLRGPTPSPILDFLPKSIERLHLTHCEKGYDQVQLLDTLEQLVHKKATLVPILHQIVADLNFQIVEKKDRVFKRILERLSKIGTITVLRNQSGYSKDVESKRVERKWGFDENIEWKKCYKFVNYRPIWARIDTQDWLMASSSGDTYWETGPTAVV